MHAVRTYSQFACYFSCAGCYLRSECAVTTGIIAEIAVRPLMQVDVEIRLVIDEDFAHGLRLGFAERTWTGVFCSLVPSCLKVSVQVNIMCVVATPNVDVYDRNHQNVVVLQYLQRSAIVTKQPFCDEQEYFAAVVFISMHLAVPQNCTSCWIAESEEPDVFLQNAFSN